MNVPRLLGSLSLSLLLVLLAGCGGSSPHADPSPRAVPSPSEASLPDAFEEARGGPEAFAASPSKGFQTVLMSNWKPSSAALFRDTVSAYSGATEFTFAPYIYAPARGRYDNANTVLDGLVAKGRNVTVCVYLGFQQAGTGADAAIASNAADFNANFLRRNANKPGVTLVVCPCLEDKGSNPDFARWATKVSSKLDASLVGKVSLRRSPLPANSNRALPARGLFAGTQLELHGAVANSDRYSNDGNFVYTQSQGERAGSMGGNNPSPQYEIGSFKSLTARNTNTTTLLWRPLYNLFRRTTRNGYVFFDKDRRVFDNTADGFDDKEKAVARTFLGL